MAKLLFKHSESAYGKFRVFIQDTTSAVGAGLTGLTFASSGLSISTIADTEAAYTAYTSAGSTIETITTIGTFATPTATKCRFKEVGLGIYEIQVADARWAVSGARALQVVVSVTGGFCAPVEIQLALFDVNSATVTVGTNNDKTGYGLSAAAVQAIWDAATTALTTAGSIGKWILDKLDVVLSTRFASASYTAPLDAAGTRTAVGLASANLDTQLDALPTAAENATATWASGTRSLTTFGTLVADIWASASRTLTAFSFAAEIRAALGMAAADLDEQLDAILAGGGGGGGGGATAAQIWAYAERTLTEQTTSSYTWGYSSADYNESVRNLCMNIRSGISDAQITAASRWAESLVIDPAMKQAFTNWPLSPTPTALLEVSAMLSAYRIESRFHAQNHEGEYIPNYYANGLKKDALEALKAICSGGLLIDDLEQLGPIGMSTADKLVDFPASHTRDYGGPGIRRGSRRQ